MIIFIIIGPRAKIVGYFDLAEQKVYENPYFDI